MRPPQLVFSDPWPEPMFRHLLPPPMIGGQVCRLLPSFCVDEWMDRKLLFAAKTGPTWPQEAVLDLEKKVHEGTDSSPGQTQARDEIDPVNSVPTEAAFSCAIAVQIGARLAASVWICTMAVFAMSNSTWSPSDSTKRTQLWKQSIGLVQFFQDNHDKISDFSLVM